MNESSSRHPPNQAPAGGGARPVSARPSTILAVDDQAADLELLTDYLGGHGWHILVAKDGESALKRAHNSHPDLILLDVLMPGLDGFETCRRLRADEATRGIPVIFMTALTEVDDKVTAFEAGAVDYITKPFQQQEVLARVTTQLGLLEQRRSLEEQAERLEEMVAERTAELTEVNARLRREMADREALEEQFRQAQKMEAIGRLTSGIAHDFNNLLTVILAFSDILMQQMDATSMPYKRMSSIHKAGERAAGLIGQLMAFCRKQVVQPVVLDLNAAIADVERMLQRVIGEDIELTTQLAADPVRILADPGQIDQILMNLAVNARDAMPRGGRLVIRTGHAQLDEAYAGRHVGVRPGRYILLAVSDTGHGMDARTLSQIFEPFFTTKEQGKGTGLGLATVYGIVSQSGGHISVSSEPGQGTEFQVYLPRTESTTEGGPTRALPVQQPRGTETILVMDDEVDVRELISSLLQEAGYRVLIARDSEEAVEAYSQPGQQIDLLLTDVVMPKQSGPALAKQASALQPRTRVLYMSGYSDSPITEHGLTQSELAFLPKPFTVDSLLRKVREVLDAPGATT